MIEATDKVFDLTLEQRAALEKRLLGRRKAPTAKRTPGPWPLTPAQEGLWLHEQFAPNSPLYNIPQAFRLTGALDDGALQKSFQLVVQRHEALRTRLSMVEHRPMQLASETEEFSLAILDLTHLEPSAREAAAAKALSDEASKPFDLLRNRLIRGVLIRLGEREHLLAVTLHHLIADHWSLGILWRDVSEAYAKLINGETPRFADLSQTFADLAQGLSEASPESLDFWKQRLGGELPDLALPFDRPRPSRPGAQGQWRPLAVPARLAAELKRLAREEQATLYMTLLAAYLVLLHRYTGENVIVTGSPVGRRDEPGADSVIGMFVNTIATLVDLQGEPSFREALQRVKAETLACHRHGRAPFEKVLEGLRRSRQGERHPVFQTIFQWVGSAATELRLPNLRVEEVPVQTGTSKFDLTFTLGEGEDGLWGTIEFAAELFDAATVDRFVTHYQTLLESIVARPGASIADLPILPEAERRQVVVEWNDTATAYPRDRTIDALFAEQAHRAPEAVALLFNGQKMSYGELDRRSGQVAAWLQKKGVTPGGNVGICLERSLELIVGLVGILKAGAAYVPLDPGFPAQRIEYMVRDSGAKIVLDPAAMRETESVTAAPSAPQHTAQSAAYIIYTSGSTGEPKGVVVPHRGVVRLVKNTNYAKFGPEEVFLQFAPVTFDASTLEIWGPLLNGGRLVIHPPGFESMAQFGTVLRENGVTTLWLTAGLFHQMVDCEPECLRGVRQLLAGGDVLSVPHVKKMLAMGVQVINGYGPTENTTFTCCYAPSFSWDGASVPIGRPISNTQCYILDKKLNPAPVGVAGELCIGGDGLAAGYLNAAELTTARFVPNPFGAPGERMYRTGDVARFRSGGVIEFLGRSDNQVKIRGFRVELGEVEHALAAHPDVQDVAVVARADASFTRRLAAYCVLRNGGAATAAALREFLASRLPAHMTPSDFVFLDKLPLTPNGKVDRRKLPEPDHTARGEAAAAAPRNETERRLAEIWQQVLGVPQVGIYDNFFELGGHSLLAMRVMARIGHVFGTAVPLGELFERPTISALAEVVRQGEGGSASNTEVIPRRARKTAAA